MVTACRISSWAFLLTSPPIPSRHIEVLVDGSPIPIVRADGGTSGTVEFSDHNNPFKLTGVTGGPGKGQITFNFVNPTAAFGLNLHTPIDMGHPNNLIAEWVFEDGSTKEMHLRDYVRSYTFVKAEVISIEDNEELKKTILKVRRQDNRKEYRIGVEYVN